jgi:YggT family protein
VQTAISYLHTFAQVLVYLYIVAIVARAAGSWFVRDFRSIVMSFLVDVTEPVLAPLRRIIPTGMGIDFSPMIAIAGLYILGQFLA